MKKTLKVIGLGLLALYVGYTLFYLWQQSQPVTTTYELVSPERRTLVKRTTVAGNMEARRQVDIKPQATGVISRLLVEPGDKVRAGEVIATVKIIPDMMLLDEAQSRVKSARISLGEVESEYERTRALYEEGVVSREVYEKITTRLASARENVAAAESQVQVITRGQSSRSGGISVTDLRSSITGVVLSVPVKEGASVSGTSVFTEGTTVAKIADMSDIIFRGFIDETEVAQLHIGMDMELHLGSMQEMPIPAKLDYIAPEGDMQNGAKMFELRATAIIPDNVSIRSGYSANAKIKLGTVHNVLSCDEKAIVFENGKPYVYVLTSSPNDDAHQQFERRAVTIGLSDGLSIELKSGVKEGELLRGNPK
ncbi:MAG: efflux RND transporter periplasmic adaptor subunit [Bacteroidaceae bacterium]|nr:efflux RND transporter periplasmic adaptor subunit [Bacteroidaceae bacterium]